VEGMGKKEGRSDYRNWQSLGARVLFGHTEGASILLDQRSLPMSDMVRDGLDTMRISGRLWALKSRKWTGYL
jgi:hypothetical protein